MGICCAFGSPEQFEKLVAMLTARNIHTTVDAAERHARFDLKMVADFKDAMKKGVK
jgi:carbon starvation protein CstA